MVRENGCEWDYAGDGVYVGFDGLGIWLHANDHANPTDKIYLEPQVLEAVNRIAKRLASVTRAAGDKE